jgi:hypothetical protein
MIRYFSICTVHEMQTNMDSMMSPFLAATDRVGEYPAPRERLGPHIFAYEARFKLS